MHLYTFVQRSSCPPWSHSSKHTMVCKIVSVTRDCSNIGLQKLSWFWSEPSRLTSGMHYINCVSSFLACLSWAEAVQHEGQSLLQCLVEFQLRLLNLRLVNVKGLISTLGVPVLRVPEARRLGNGRVGQEVNRMEREKNENWSREARETTGTGWQLCKQNLKAGRWGLLCCSWKHDASS